MADLTQPSKGAPELCFKTRCLPLPPRTEWSMTFLKWTGTMAHASSSFPGLSDLLRHEGQRLQTLHINFYNLFYTSLESKAILHTLSESLPTHLHLLNAWNLAMYNDDRLANKVTLLITPLEPTVALCLDMCTLQRRGDIVCVGISPHLKLWFLLHDSLTYEDGVQDLAGPF